MSLNAKLRKAQRHVNRNHHSTALTNVSDKVPKTFNVCGPYPNRDKWRLILIDETGRKSRVFESRKEAESVKATLLDEARARQGRTVGQSLDEYRDYRIQHRGVKPTTAAEHCRHLRELLPLDLPITSLTPERAQQLYLDYANRPNKRNGRPLSPNTHHWVLLVAKCWSRWCVKIGILSAHPFSNVEAIGKCNAGKQQLRLDEAQKLNQFLLERVQSGDHAAVGVLLMLHLGLRQGEVSARIVRDVDGDGRILHIPFGKTDSSRRRLKVPDWLRPMLRELIVNRAPSDRLFASRQGLLGRTYWGRKVREYCKQARVPEVCPHSLRGLHATLAIEEGATSESVARALGHTSFAMTAKHCASADSVANARASKTSQVLCVDPDPLTALLHSLSPEQRAELQRRLIAQPSPPTTH